MLEKLSFWVLFLLDLYFTASGLLYLKTAGEAMYALLFLIILWFFVWSLHKIKGYRNEVRKISFIRYYFSFFLMAGNVFAKEKQLGPTKFFRLANVILSAIVGLGVILFLIFHSLSTTIFTHDLFLRYWYVFLFISIYPLLIYLVKKLILGKDKTSFLEGIMTFFPLRFTQLFIFITTFFTPIAWLIIVFLSYIIAKSNYINKNKPAETI